MIEKFKIIEVKKTTLPNFMVNLDDENSEKISLDTNEIAGVLVSFGWMFATQLLKCNKQIDEDTLEFEFKKILPIFISEKYIGYLDKENKIIVDNDLEEIEAATTFYLENKKIQDRQIFIDTIVDKTKEFIDLFATTRDYKNYDESIVYQQSSVSEFFKEANYLKDSLNKILLEAHLRINELLQDETDTEEVSVFLNKYILKWPE